MLIFEKSVKGRTGVLLDECDVPAVALNAPRRAQEARLPEVSEIDVIRHYTALSKKAHGVDDGFYPLGSCTMKYNPRVNDAVAALSGFTMTPPPLVQSTISKKAVMVASITSLMCRV